jgi:hypothetical protein
MVETSTEKGWLLLEVTRTPEPFSELELSQEKKIEQLKNGPPKN